MAISLFLYIDLFAKASLYRTEARMKNGEKKRLPKLPKKIYWCLDGCLKNFPRAAPALQAMMHSLTTISL
jgi:hypothetical protein